MHFICQNFIIAEYFKKWMPEHATDVDSCQAYCSMKKKMESNQRKILNDWDTVFAWTPFINRMQVSFV